MTVGSAGTAWVMRRGPAAVVADDELVAGAAVVADGGADVSVEGGGSKDGKPGRSRLGPRGGCAVVAVVVGSDVVVVGFAGFLGGRVDVVGLVVVVVGFGFVVVDFGLVVVVVGRGLASDFAVVVVVDDLPEDGGRLPVVVVGFPVVVVVARGFGLAVVDVVG